MTLETIKKEMRERFDKRFIVDKSNRTTSGMTVVADPELMKEFIDFQLDICAEAVRKEGQEDYKKKVMAIIENSVNTMCTSSNPAVCEIWDEAKDALLHILHALDE